MAKTDYIMDEAMSFATTHLTSFSVGKMCSSHFAKRIQNALGISQYHNMEIIVAMEYIPFYEQEDDHDVMLLKFSKLNFNLLQLHYTQELKIVSEYVLSSVTIVFSFYVYHLNDLHISYLMCSDQKVVQGPRFCIKVATLL